MAARDMTDEERKKFESDQLRHAGEAPESAPASDTERAKDPVPPRMPPVIPNPD